MGMLRVFNSHRNRGEAVTDAEKAELALWALTNGPLWLGRSIKRTPEAEYVAVYEPRPYSGPEIIETTYHADPWECLRLARAHFQADGGDEHD